MASISGKDQHQLDSALPGTARETKKRITCFQKLAAALDPNLSFQSFHQLEGHLLLVSTSFLFKHLLLATVKQHSKHMLSQDILYLGTSKN